MYRFSCFLTAADLLWKYESRQEADEAGDAPKNEQVETGTFEEGSDMEIFRMKALLDIKGEDRPHYLQGVQELFEIEAGILKENSTSRIPE